LLIYIINSIIIKTNFQNLKNMTFPFINKKNQEEEKPDVSSSVLEWLDDFSIKILEAANLSEKESKEVLKNRQTVSSFVTNTINQANKKIFNNNENLELLLNYKPNIFSDNYKIKLIIKEKLKKDFNKNKNLAFFVLKNYIKSDVKKEEIDNFISEIAWEDIIKKEKLENIFSELLEKRSKYMMRDSQKYFYNIKDKEVLNIIISSKIVDKSWILNKDILKNINKEINEKLDEKELKDKEKIFLFLLKYFNFSEENIKNNDLKIFIKSLIDLIEINKKVEEVEENQQNNPSQSSLEKGRGSTEKIEEDEFLWDSSFLDFCYPWCLLSEIWNNYEIDLWENQKIEISKQEFDEFNEKSLENYINFIKILRQTKLDFLLENKYKSGFMQFLTTKLGWLNYKTWEWFWEFHTLKALTIIWNLIWIPEKYMAEKWELWEFDWIISAINVFSEINSTWNIANKKVWTVWGLIWPTIVEKRMLQLWILWENWWFSLEKSKEVLWKWKLSN